MKRLFIYKCQVMYVIVFSFLGFCFDKFLFYYKKGKNFLFPMWKKTSEKNCHFSEIKKIVTNVFYLSKVERISWRNVCLSNMKCYFPAICFLMILWSKKNIFDNFLKLFWNLFTQLLFKSCFSTLKNLIFENSKYVNLA